MVAPRRQAKSNNHSWVLWAIFAFWLLAFFPQWYFLSYTKIRELRDLVGSSVSQQRVRLHTSELQVMTNIAQWAKNQPIPVRVVVPPRGTFAQLSVLQLWNAIRLTENEYLQLSRWEQVDLQKDELLVFLVPATSERCVSKSCFCPNGQFRPPKYWKVEP